MFDVDINKFLWDFIVQRYYLILGTYLIGRGLFFVFEITILPAFLFVKISEHYMKIGSITRRIIESILGVISVVVLYASSHNIFNPSKLIFHFLYLLLLCFIVYDGSIKDISEEFNIIKNKLSTIPNNLNHNKNNIDRNKIIARGILHKASILKVNNVLNSFGHNILSIEECISYCTKFENSPTPSLFCLDEKKVLFFEKNFNNINLNTEWCFKNKTENWLSIFLVCIFIIGDTKILDTTFSNLLNNENFLWMIVFFPFCMIILLYLMHRIIPYYKFLYEIEFFKSKIKDNVFEFSYYLLYKKTLDEYNAINEKIALEKAFAAKKEREEQERKRKEQERLELEKQFKLKKHVKTYWYSLDGFTFEKEIAKLYKMLGYKVETTKLVGDGGVDIILYKDEKKIIVQCKAHKHKIGPEPVRALWGVKDDFNADEVILIALSGITTGAMDFVKNKKYQILNADDIATLSISVNYINYDAKINK